MSLVVSLTVWSLYSFWHQIWCPKLGPWAGHGHCMAHACRRCSGGKQGTTCFCTYTFCTTSKVQNRQPLNVVTLAIAVVLLYHWYYILLTRSVEVPFEGQADFCWCTVFGPACAAVVMTLRSPAANGSGLLPMFDAPSMLEDLDPEHRTGWSEVVSEDFDRAR